MNKKNYLNLLDLTKSLKANVSKLEKGKLSISEVNEMFENSRDLHERLTIIRYKALLDNKEKANPEEEKIEVVVENKVEEGTISFNFESIEKEEKVIEISPNQKNLLDEIQEVGGEVENSINEKYANSDRKETVADKLTKTKIEDLKKGMSLNQKFLFTNDLFDGKKEEFEKTITKINSFDTLIESRAYLAANIEVKYKWDLESDTVQEFITLLERKFI